MLYTTTAYLLILMAFPAGAKPSSPVVRDICGIQVPPSRYDNKPPLHPVDGPHYISAREVARECIQSGENKAVGCTTLIGLWFKRKFVPLAYKVVIAKFPTPGTLPACTQKIWQASILRHERAHMAGWPRNHSN